MKIKFTEIVAGVNFVYQVGQIVDMPAKEAQRWLNAGVAVPYVEPKPVPPPPTPKPVDPPKPVETASVEPTVETTSLKKKPEPKKV